MTKLSTHEGQKYLSDVSLQTVADIFGTPCYVYDAAAIDAAFHHLNTIITVPHRLCYAMKANDNLAIVQHMIKLGAGLDIVSGGELARGLKVGARAQDMIFSGVGKSEHEITQALLSGIGCINIESIPELERINRIATELGVIAPIGLRINPDVQVSTHHHIATGHKEHKFGIPYTQFDETVQAIKTATAIKLIGVGCHLGSQLNAIAPYEAALDKIIGLYHQLITLGFAIEFIDMGGGMAIQYDNDQGMNVDALAQILNARMKPLPATLILEPGRMLIGPAGVLLTRVEYIKSSQHKQFAIVDAGMNDLLRPAMYDAFHQIVPVCERAIKAETYDVVGPVCESADCLGKQRTLAIEPGDVLAVLNAGAYGSSMSSMYNSRPLIAEIMIADQKPHCIRSPAHLSDLWRHEHTITGENTTVHFTKMHGLGNDFVVICLDNQSIYLTPGFIRRIADRHTGIGCDQVLIVQSTPAPGTFKYRIFNSDGSEASHCGNGARAVARYVRERGLSHASDLIFEMNTRTIHTHFQDNDHISVDMGSVTFDKPFELMLKQHNLSLTPVMLANPHAILFAPYDGDMLKALGELLNPHPHFPKGVNVSMVHIERGAVYLNVYERGVGLTQACGSAACAAAALAIRSELVSSPCTVHMPGGDCLIEWQGSAHPIILTGPATHVYDGVWHDSR